MAVNSKSDDLWRKRHISLVTRHRMAMPVHGRQRPAGGNIRAGPTHLPTL